MASFDVVAKLRADTSSLVKGLKEGELASSQFATKMGGASNALAMGTAAAVVVAGAALFKLGENFHSAYKTIRVATGATGDELHGLEQSFRNVFAKTPASMADVSTAIASVAQNLKLTGPQLESTSLEIIKLSRITGTDLKGNLESVIGMFKNFGVTAGDQKGALDQIYRASQVSGISVSSLADSMKKAGPALRSLGFGFTESAAMIATIGKAGLEVDPILMAFKRTLVTASKDGKDASIVFADAFKSIQDAKTPLEAQTIAMETFGKRSGGQLADSIRTGKLAYGDLIDVIKNGQDTIDKTSDDVTTFGAVLTKLGHGAMLALEPIATGVFNGMTKAIKYIQPVLQTIIGGVQTLASAFNLLPTPLQLVVPLLAAAAVAMKGLLLAKAAAVAISGNLMGAFAGIAGAAGNMVTSFINILPGMETAATAAGIGVQMALGPVIIAIGAAFIAFTLLTAGKRDAEKESKNMKDSLDAETGAWTDNTKKLIENAFYHGKTRDAMDKAGISMDRLKGFMEDQSGQWVTQTKALELADAAMGSYSTSHEDNIKQTHKLADELRAQGGPRNQLLADLAEEGLLTNNLVDKLYNEADGYDEKQKGLEIAAIQQAKMNLLTGAAAVAAAEAARVNGLEADSIQKVMDKNLAATNPLFAALSAQRDVNTAKETLTKLEQEGKKGTQEYAAALDDWLKSGLSYADALTKMDVAQLKGDSSAAKLQTALDMMAKVGVTPTAEQLDNLKTRLGLVTGAMNDIKDPGQAYTDILNKMKVDGMDPAKLAAGDYLGQLQHLADKMDPANPLRVNILQTISQLQTLGGQKPDIDIRVETYAAITAIQSVEDRIAAMKQFAYQPASLNFTYYPDGGVDGNHYTPWATGGMMTDGWFTVGEQGPEMGYKSGASTRIFSNSQSRSLLSANSGAAGSNGANYSINVNVDATADKASIGRVIVEAISSFEKRAGAGWRS